MRENDDGIRSSRTVDCQMCTEGILYAMASMSLITGGQNVGISTCWCCCLVWCSFEKRARRLFFLDGARMIGLKAAWHGNIVLEKQ